MQTLADLEKMKEKKVEMFGTQYDYLFAELEDFYIAKLDGMARIKSELSNWDDVAKKKIVELLISRLQQRGVEFDLQEMYNLAQN